MTALFPLPRLMYLLVEAKVARLWESESVVRYLSPHFSSHQPLASVGPYTAKYTLDRP